MKHNIPLKSLYSFIAVAETGSMVKAADSIHVSHSAISQAIKSLEQQLEVRLFDRVGRQVYLNDAGKLYYQRVSPAVQAIISASEEVKNKDKDHHSISLNMVNSLALHWWIPRVDKLQNCYAELDIRLSNFVGDVDLERRNIDMAIFQGDPQNWQKYHCEKLADDELVLVCSPSLLKPETTNNINELLNRFPAIQVLNARRNNNWQIWAEHNHIACPKAQKNRSFETTAQALQAVTRELGLLVTHKQFVLEKLEYGELVQLGSAVIHPQQSFFYACKADKLKHTSIQQLIAWLKNEFLAS